MLNNFLINNIRKKYFSKYEKQFTNIIGNEIIDRVKLSNKYKNIVDKTNIFMYKIIFISENAFIF